MLVCFFIVLLSGCAVRFVTHADLFPDTYIQQWQKEGQIGTTDPEKRMDVAVACGATNRSPHVESIWGSGSNETISDVNKRARKWKSCMNSKGYIFIRVDQCGTSVKNNICL